MSLIGYVRESVIQILWHGYYQYNISNKKIIDFLEKKHCPLLLDHFAIIDLPSQSSGISVLNQIFSALHYLPQGWDYLPDKQNSFMWLAPIEAENQLAEKASPQIVLADFCLDAMEGYIVDILRAYICQIPPFPWKTFHQLCGAVYHDDYTASQALIKLITAYCQQREWQLPILKDYQIIKNYNELLAWVLIYGKCINHFGLNIQLSGRFESLENFNDLIQQELNIQLNNKNGRLIQGQANKAIAQSATQGDNVSIKLKDGDITLASPFMEFIWRAPLKINPVLWKDYFRSFIGVQADSVIESVYK